MSSKCRIVASESDIFKMKVLARVEERIWSGADSAHKHVEIRVQSEGVVFS